MRTIRTLLPNLITAIGMLLGVWAIFSAVRGGYENAAWLLVACVVVDKLDGTAARLLRASSPMGIQMDSLSDVTTFVVAPAVVWAGALTDPGSPFHLAPRILIPYGAASVYVAAGAFRLARFNCEASEGLYPHHFNGLPTTMAGAINMTLFLTLSRHLPVAAYAGWIPGVLLVLAVLMVSGLQLPKLRKSRSRAMNAFTLVNLVLVVPLILLRWYPEYLLLLALGYAVVGFSWARWVDPPARAGDPAASREEAPPPD